MILIITAKGDYGFGVSEIPNGIVNGLKEEIASHIKAYGFKDVEVSAILEVKKEN